MNETILHVVRGNEFLAGSEERADRATKLNDVGYSQSTALAGDVLESIVKQGYVTAGQFRVLFRAYQTHWNRQLKAQGFPHIGNMEMLTAAAELVAADQKRKLEKLASKIDDTKQQDVTRISVVNHMLKIESAFADLDTIHELGGLHWQHKERYWLGSTALVQEAVRMLPHYEVDESCLPFLSQGGKVFRRHEREELRGPRNQLSAEQVQIAMDTFQPTTPLVDGRILTPQQIDGVYYLLTEGRAILADVMGLGKTLQAVVAATLIGDYTVVICPSGAVPMWKREFDNLGFPAFVFSYEKAPTVAEVLKLTNNNPYTLIVDEAHYLQNAGFYREKVVKGELKQLCVGAMFAGKGVQRTAKLMEHRDTARSVFCLTGTPVMHGRPSAIAQMLYLIGSELADNLMLYWRKYCGATWERTGWNVFNTLHAKELHQRMTEERVLLRREKKDLPPKTRRMVRVSLTPSAANAYNKNLKHAWDVYEQKKIEKIREGKVTAEGADSADKIVLYQQLRKFGEDALTEGTITRAREVMAEGHKVLIFVTFKNNIQTIIKRLERELEVGDDETISPKGVIITGDQSREQKDAAEKAFQTNPDIRFAIGTPKAMGTNFTLTKATYALFPGRCWTFEDMEQCEDRIHRLTTTESVFCEWLQLADDNGVISVYSVIDPLLQSKHSNTQEIMHGMSKTIDMHEHLDAVIDFVASRISQIA